MSTLAYPLFLRLRRVQLPALALIALLQRTPVLRLLVTSESVWASSSLGQVLRSTAVIATAVGAVDTLAGATTFTASPASPTTATTGTAFSAAFAVTGAPSTVKSYTITGLPPGLTVSGATVSGSNLLLNTSTGTITGTPTTAGNYSATITAWEKANATGKFKGYTYTINVSGGATATAPSITGQPASQTVTAGGAASFSVAASGTAPFTYQWNKDGGAISGATSATYSIGATTTGDAGTYSVVVTNSAGSATSNGATLTVNAAAVAPSITTQPSAQTVNTGSAVTFTVAASGTAPLSYQWRKDGANLSGATSSSYNIASAATGDAGTYSVVVTNSAGSATSNGATLTVNATNTATAPSITTQPSAQTVNTGSAVTFTVAASGTAPLSYQWRKDGADLGGATSSSYNIASAATGDAGTYSVVVTNSAGSATSNGATLTVNATNTATAPSITTQPSAQTVNTGSAVTFTVAASGTAPLSYQWRKDGADLGGATSSSYNIASAATGDAGTYSVVVTNSAGSATSNGATLTVNATNTATAPSITTQPSAQTVNTGSAVTFTVAASGTAPLSYQWRKDGADLGGATSSSYNIASAATGDAGTYSVVVTNSAGSATSNGATLTVNATNTATAPSITTQPAAQTVNTGSAVTFTVAASGTAPLSYQWRKDGANLAGATSSSYSIASAAAGDAGTYSVVVTNSAGSATSTGALLTVNASSAPSTIFPHITALAFDGSGRLYATDSTSNTVQRIGTDGTVYLVAGSRGNAGSSNGSGANALFNQPGGIAATNGGVIYVADTANAVIRRIGTDGSVTTFAGSTALRGNVNGTGTGATFSAPIGVALDASGNLYVADSTNHTIRKITPEGVVTTYAGQAGSAGSADGTATTARFNHPTAVAVDDEGNVYVADTNNNTIRKIKISGEVKTVAGLAGVSGATDGKRSEALFNQPQGIACDSDDHIYVADTGNSSIRRISDDTVTTVAGLSTVSRETSAESDDTASGTTGTSSNVTSSLFNHPLAVVVSSSTLYVGDTGSAAVRTVTSGGTVTTLTLTLDNSGNNSNSGNSTGNSSSNTGTGTGTSSGSSAGGGGGGGAPTLWLPLAVAALLGARRWRRSPAVR